ncbi:MAG: histidinol-phosphatase [Spirochaetaceae bacterium]|jgi:histidinol-phosphatase (PHP family)|nr:histidinol-phosphatase [Spirochaetaceae bacterium]
MMIKSNYHCHSRYCDGKGEMEEYIISAISRGFHALGFSSHAPFEGQDWTMDRASLPEYFEDLKFLKNKYRDQLQIYTGLEIDYVDEEQNPGSPFYRNLELDFSIGSYHMISHEGSYWAIDGPDDHFLHLLNHCFRGSMTAFSEAYYRGLTDMVKIGGFDILGHMDLIKKKNKGNRFFNEDSPWYQNQIRKALDVIERWGGMIEVNTGGISRGAIDTVYPSPWIIEKAARLKIPFCLNSDSHRPEHLDYYFDESLEILRDAGIKKLHALYDGSWQSFDI